MSKRFIRRGVSQFLFSPAIVDLENPTRAEIDAAQNLTKDIADLAGWMLENSAAATPDMSSTFEKSIPGLDSAADSSLTCYEGEDEPTVAEETLVKGVTGVVIIMRKGDRPGSGSMDLFPVRCSSKGAEFSAGNDPARFVASFGITDEPALDVVIPAAATPPVGG